MSTTAAEKSTRTRKTYVNLAVDDLDRAVAFFTTLGFAFEPRFTDANAACMVLGADAFVMLLARPYFETFTKRPLCDTSRETEALIAISCDSRDEVDRLVETALAAGGRPAMDRQDHGFMYGWSFYDPDGHHWEVLWMDESAVPEAADAGGSDGREGAPGVRGSATDAGPASGVALAAKIVPHLWYVEEALEAAELYVSLFPDSRIDAVSQVAADTPGRPAGSVTVVDFTLAGQSFQAIAAGPFDPFNHAISFVVGCDDQAEVDRYWEALADGGTIEQCGWVRDRFGVSWQVVPRVLGEMMKHPDRDRARRVTEAMLTMTKLDVPTLESAFAAE